jgi:outer membrane biosynthesis protein TonB
MKAAREAQTFKPATEPESTPDPDPDTARPAKKTSKPRPKKPARRKTPPKAATPTTDETTTANAAARAAAGLETGPSLSRAEYMALRRATVASISFEIHPDDKAQLLREATENGRTLRGEIMHRLGFDE